MKICISNISLFLLAIFLFSSCVTNRDTRFLQKTKKKYPKGEYVEYKLQVDDEINIILNALNKESSNFINSQQSGASQGIQTYRIFSDSTVDLPYLNKVKLAGLTLREAESKLKLDFKDYIEGDFSLRVHLNSKVFYMFGDAGKGQFLIYKDRLNIYEAIALSGNIGLSANRKKVKLLRNSPYGMKIYEFDIRSKSIIDSEYYYIQPNDMIYFDRSRSNFYKIVSFTSLVGMVTSTLSFVLLVAQYSN